VRFQLLPVLFCLIAAGISALRAEDASAGPNLMSGDFESGTVDANPWGGFDNKGLLHVWTGQQYAVDDNGRVLQTSFSPGVSIGDLNGDGLPDLVVADARGFFWFFPNSGKPNAPAFDHPEIMPIWLSGSPGTRDVIPRFQLVDFDGDGKLDLVAGNFAGELYYIHNNGTRTTPDFRMPPDRTTIEVPTHTQNLLWCNYLAPFLYNWSGSGRLDLLMGEGTYSANSIYLLTNTGNNGSPTFNEQHKVKLIPGMGREHLTPQVLDWNGDGKPDVITGERTGYVDVYLNQTPPNAPVPLFGEPQHVFFGKKDKIGAFTTVCGADINGDKLFDLVVGSVDGHVSYALNQGTPGNPKFGDLVPFKGKNPFPSIQVPKTWVIDNYQPYGTAYELLECTNAKAEPGFTPPPGFLGHGALKFSIFNPNNTYFKDLYVPDLNDRRIQYTGERLNLQTETAYNLSFWVRTAGSVSHMTWHLEGMQRNAKGKLVENYYQGDVSTGDSWSQYSDRIQIRSKIEKKNTSYGVKLTLIWEGDGAVYFDGFSMKKTE
jgi:hypothetical protein